ncbi:ABC transporter permease [Brucella pseudogrignonensis]|uniref:ABC transporter permease subunit n=1 Tax=Brucella pseudogrignonensis TaxID=419475 RepID=A0A256G529_9HYPH|nr:ABC transporter permease subunit [Brucella pseudogrignonensis]EMG52136.1 amino-acid ABC transporter permease protein [Ochrobactrum sp. CDB2]MCM0752261.1 ABC transporter permease [Brucella pseudogrignonensis]NNV20015.1 ABC transporter permease subunit [Brucella pseudogrignonensis]OYR22158.1 amino ABC transporter, permease, 3-TM region, His/Glu/Gln/Arg/opine family domain protein [Brucella pseudogrignonensis]
MNSVFPAIVDWSLLAYDPPGWGRALFFGLLNTLQIAVCGYLLGLLLGVCGAAGKLYGSPVIKDLLTVYTTVVRGIPELVLLLILYYAGTQFLNTIMAKLGYGSVDVSGLVAGIIVIGLVQGAYATEVIRGAILAIAPGQIEAGRAFGMSPIKVMHRITLPAMLPFAIPGLSNLWLIATKDTALLAVVGFTELTLVTRQAAGATKAYMLFFLTAGAIYLGITLISTAFLRAVERHFKRGFPEAR